MMNRFGVTLVELLITILISSIAFFALTVPFVAERSQWGSGNRQTQAQRDAQLAMRAISRVARESTSFTPATGTFATLCGNQTFVSVGGQLTWTDCTGTPAVLIDGVRSQVGLFSMTAASAKLVDVQLRVDQAGGQEQESVRSQFFLRNAS